MRLTIILGSMLMLLPSAAHADWQYTKWGMTPVQVAAASRGAAQIGSGDPGDKYAGADIGATGTYVSGNYSFKVVFYFVAGKLADVRLALVSGEPFALKNSLLGAYGAPFYEGRSLGLTTWHDTTKNNRVDLLMIGSASTSLEYRPLKDVSASGL